MNLAQRVVLGYIRTKLKLLAAISKKKAAKEAFQLFCTPPHRNRKPLPKIFAEAETLQFTLNKTNVIGWRWNKGADKKLLIIHGFESSVTNFDRYIRPAINKGYEVLAFDAPAHGRSGGKTINAVVYKEMILEINRRFGPVQCFMAHSFGGLAVSLALEEISHTEQYKLILIAPATETTSAIASLFQLLRIDESVRMEFDRIIVKMSGLTPAWFSIHRAMRNIRAKVIWFHDNDDTTTPIADALKVKDENYPNVNFVISSGLGHRRIYRENKVTKAILDFL